jgi:RNA polymerase sigma-70 factor, ECF subfamily
MTEETSVLHLKASDVILPFVNDLYRVALSMSRSKDKAEELVSECILRGLEQLHTLKSEGRAKQWLLRILSNLWLQDLRKEKRHPESSIEKDDSFSFYTVAQDSFRDTYHPERSLIQQMLDEDITYAIDRLPDHYRVAIQLCEIEGMSYEEISEVLNIPIGTVRSRIARGRATLQHMLWQHAVDHGLVPAPSTVRSDAAEPECNCK